MRSAYRLAFFISLLFCTVGVFVTFFFLNTPLFEQVSPKKNIIYFEKGMSAGNLVELLSKQQPLRAPFCFSWYLRLLADSERYQAGIYVLPPGITPKQLNTMLVEGRVFQQSLTITEGQLSKNIIAYLIQNALVPIEDNLIEKFKQQCVLCDRGLEGIFLADTYFYPAGSQSSEVLLRANRALDQVLKAIWLQRNKELPYKTPYELLIAASIIEKETSREEEKPLVSAVIVNRLQKKMRLQMDPTVIYGLGDRFEYPLTRDELKIPTAYNTYKQKGLPPTPISNVGLTSLKAAALPAKVDYLYFVAKGDGTHQFSRTLEQQTQAIKQIKLEKKKPWQQGK